jgi:hypothetical protein
MGIFRETAAARADTALRAVPAGRDPERDAGSRGLRPDLCAATGLIRRTADARALATAAAAADRWSLPGFTEQQAPFFAAAGDAAQGLLGPDRPVTLTFMTLDAESLYDEGEVQNAVAGMRKVSRSQMNRFGASSGETVTNCIKPGALLQAAGDRMGAAVSFSDAPEALEETRRRRPRSLRDGPGRPGLQPGRAGRDILEASIRLAETLCLLDDPRPASAVLPRFTDSLPIFPVLPDLPDLPDLPADPSWPFGWPLPPELGGRALCVAGEAAVLRDDRSRRESLLRQSVDWLGPNPVPATYLSRALAQLSLVLSRRGDSASSREAALPADRAAEIISREEGHDSAAALDAPVRAADRREAPGNADAAVELHRRVPAARKRLLGQMDERPRQSRAEIRRIVEKCRQACAKM